MRKKFISHITAFVVAVTMIFGGSASAFAATGTDGGLLWYYKDSSNSAMMGVSAPVAEGGYVYMASGKTLYKFNDKTGGVVAKATLSGSIGLNKLAPTVAAGQIFVPIGGAKLDIVDASTMSLKKSITYAKDQANHQSIAPAVYSESDNSVYLGSWRKGYGGTYAKVSLDNYEVKEVAKSDVGFYWSGACTEGNYVVFGSASNGTDDRNTPSDGDAVLYVYDKTTGNVIETELPDSGCICSAVVKNGDKYYFTAKSGKLYEAQIISGKAEITRTIKLAGKSTCTPVIKDGKAYVGSMGRAEVINLGTGKVEASYAAPEDVKAITLSGDDIFGTYNNYPGGIYDLKAGRSYFTPEKDMQNYCISTIAEGSDGTLYYTNDSNYLMAVRDKDKIAPPVVAPQKTVTAKLYGSNDFAVSWSSQTVKWSNGVNSKATVKYKVQYKKYGGSWYTASSGTTGTSLKLANRTYGAKYSFKVTPFVTVNGKTYYGTSKSTDYQYTLKAPSRPTISKSSRSYVKVKWSGIRGETGYQVYRATSKSGKYYKVKSVKMSTYSYPYAKIKTTRNKTYYYKVRAYKYVGNGKYVYGPYSSVSKAYKLR